jgi:hypothetical protein
LLNCKDIGHLRSTGRDAGRLIARRRDRPHACDPDLVEWLAFSLVASLVLTVVLNVAIRLWPGAADRGTRRLVEWTERQEPREIDGRPGQVRVIAPWKAMLIASVVLTIVLNVAIRLF